MSDLSPEQWRKVSPHLDVALTMDESSRGEYLASIGVTDPALAAELRALLEEHRHLGEFLDGGGALLAQEQPESIGPYRVIGTLGEGGMGIVYLARQTSPVERTLAIKVVRLFGGKALMARFAYERQALAMMEHPNIARLYDAGVTAEGHPYFAMEYVNGEPITKYSEAGGIGLRERLRIFQQVCSAVQHAHQKGVIHRDLKPSNILVMQQDGVAVPKVIDFGIAKAVNPATNTATSQTEVGVRVGTPRYMSPEQETGGDVDSTSDIYSLGVVLFELLTGVKPGESTRGVKQGPTGDLQWICLKALDPEKARRYASASEFAADIERHLRDEPVLARPPGTVYTLRKLFRRNRSAAVLGTLALLATIGGGLATWFQAQSARSQRDFAFQQLARAEEINDLDSYLLYDAAPMGKPFTAFDLLAKAERLVGRQVESTPDSFVPLLISIGQIYKSADASDRAERILEQAYKTSRALSDPSTRARASCALASVASDKGQKDRAIALWSEGLRELPAKPEYALDRGYCLRQASAVSRDVGTGTEAISYLLQAREEMKRSPYHSRLADLAVLIDLAESYRIDGQLQMAVATSEESDVLLKALGREETQRAGTLYNNWALSLNLLGRELESEKMFRRAIEISKANDGEEAVSPMLLLNYGRVLSDLTRTREADGYIRKARDRAKTQGLDNVVLQSWIMQGEVHRDLKEFDRSSKAIEEAAAMIRTRYPAGHVAFAAEASQRSLTALARGDLGGALRLASLAVQLVEDIVKSGGPGKDFLPKVLLRRSEIRLKLGDVLGAVADAQRSYDLLRVAIPSDSFSSTIGRTCLALGRAKQARGETREAQSLYATAADHLRRTRGESHPLTAEAVRLAASR